MDDVKVLDAIFTHAGEGMVLLNQDHSIAQVNGAFEQQTGMSAQKTSLCKIQDILCRKNGGDFSEVLDHLKREPYWRGELCTVADHGKSLEFSAIVLPLNLENENPSCLFILNPAHLEVQNGSLSIQTQDDFLTGLPNVNIFLDRVQQALVSSRREKQPLALLMIDLDRFALINDGLGHDFGDLVLKEIAARLKDSLRESDSLVRITGGEFGLLVKVTADDHAALVGEKILTIISNPLIVKEQKFVLTASIGIVTFHEGETNAGTMMENAESALHQAKKLGGNSYHFFAEDLNQIAKERIELENSLRQGLEGKEFLLYYQPKVEIVTNNIVGMEALIRWQRPEFGMVPPFKFIPVAEETGLIIDIGSWVLYEACRQNKEWQDRGLPALPVAVNVSARQFQLAGFPGEVVRVIEETGLDSEFLELEITESMLMSDIEQTITKLNELAGIGLTLAIDDFGTGYSNLSYLNRFPVRTLKIDRAFIKDVDSDANNAALTKSIINMSHSLNLEIVAEGAENCVFH